MADALQFIIDRTTTPIGEGVIISDADGAIRLFYWDDPTHRWKRALLGRYGEVTLKEKKGAFGHARTLKNYFDGDVEVLDAMPVAFAGTPFQLKVWNTLRKIPGGTTTSYGALAKKIGKPDAVRAVGLANGQNPVGLIVPCHRVIGSNGSLTGYGGGLPRKRWLLEHEARHAGTDLFHQGILMNPFKALHAGPDVLVLPNAWDAGSARVTEIAGAKAIATSSAAVAWAHGYPDGEALPFDILLNTVREVSRVVSIPITADIEAGYAQDDSSCVDNVGYLVDAGAAGINIEDGTGSPDLLASRIEAIKKSAGDSVWINARTDVYLHNLAQGEAAYDETVTRARRYRDAGADSIFIPMAAGDELLARFVRAIDAPINVLAWPGVPPIARLREIGIRRLSAGSGIAKMSLNHIFALAQAFLAEGRSEPLTGPTLMPGGLNAIMKRD